MNVETIGAIGPVALEVTMGVGFILWLCYLFKKKMTEAWREQAPKHLKELQGYPIEQFIEEALKYGVIQKRTESLGWQGNQHTYVISKRCLKLRSCSDLTGKTLASLLQWHKTHDDERLADGSISPHFSEALSANYRQLARYCRRSKVELIIDFANRDVSIHTQLREKFLGIKHVSRSRRSISQ